MKLSVIVEIDSHQRLSFPMGAPFYLQPFSIYGGLSVLGHVFDLSGSRYVNGHVAILFGIRYFPLMVLWNSNDFRDNSVANVTQWLACP